MIFQEAGRVAGFCNEVKLKPFKMLQPIRKAKKNFFKAKLDGYSFFYRHSVVFIR